MAEAREDIILAHLHRSRDVLERMMVDADLVATIIAIADRIALALRQGAKLLLAGNGGSASDAQHIAAEFVGRYIGDRAPFAAVALTTDSSALTSISNDYGFEHVFARQIHAIGRKGDVFVAISTSGKSQNMVTALRAARELGLTTVGFTRATPTPLRQLCDLVLAIPSEEVALIQQMHITVAHAICGLVEQTLSDARRG
jgi:D-sedoheptulose 7-phosphate isomerase